MADKRDILIRLLGEETVSKMTDRASGGLDRFGDKLEATERDAKGLDDQIREVEGNLKALAVAFSRTQDEVDRVDLTRAIRKQQTELRKLAKARDLLPDFSGEGSKGALSAVAGFVKNFPTALRAAMSSGPGMAVGAVLAVGVVPMLGAAVAGAVVGGVGVGGVIGGVALAARDTRVKAAGKALGEAISEDLEDSASRFVQPTLHGIAIIRSAWDDVADDVDGVFAASSRYVEPLARGVGGLMRELGPGLRTAAEAAGPIVRELGEGLPRIGRAISDVLTDLSGDADEGASAIRAIVIGAETMIRTGGVVIGVLSDMYRGIITVSEAAASIADKIWGWVPGLGDAIGQQKATLGELKAAMDGAGESGAQAGDKAAGGLRKIGEGAAAAAGPVQTLADQMREMAGVNISAEQASIRLTQAIAAATEAGKSNTDGISRNNAKQAENRQRLVELANAANDASKRIMEQTGSQALANAESQRGRDAFMRTAKAMDVEAADAKRLADQLFAIPEAVKTTVTANTDPAMESARSLVRRINNMHARISVSARGTTSYGGGAHTGDGYSTGYSAGGYVSGPGPKGVDSKPAILAPGEGVLTSGEVDALGGPAGFERLRAAIRSGGSPAAATPAAGGTAPGGGMSVVNHYTINVAVPVSASPVETGRQVVEVIRAYEQRSGAGWRQ